MTNIAWNSCIRNCFEMIWGTLEFQSTNDPPARNVAVCKFVRGDWVIIWNNYGLELGISRDLISKSAEHPLNQTSLLLNKLGTWDLEVQILPLWKASVWAVFIPNQTFKFSHQPKKEEWLFWNGPAIGSIKFSIFVPFITISQNFSNPVCLVCLT